MTQIGAFFAAVGFLTRIPVPESLATSGQAHATVYFPVVGAGIGLLAALILAAPLGPTTSAILAVVAMGWTTGGLHWDGWADTLDAYFSGVCPDRAQEILADPRVGAHAVWGTSALVLLQVVVLSQSSTWLVMSGAVVGRWMMVMSLRFSPAMRSDGVAHHMSRDVHWVGGSFACVGLLSATVLLGGSPAQVVASALGGATLGVLFLWRLIRRLNGANGDVHGAIGIFTQTCVWLVGAEVLPIIGIR